MQCETRFGILHCATEFSIFHYERRCCDISDIEKRIWRKFQDEVGEKIGVNPSFSKYDKVTLNMDYEGDNKSPAAGGKRIDGVVKTEGKIWVCEVKPILNYKSVGQVMAYTVLYSNYFEVKKELLPLVVFAQTTSRSEGVIPATKTWGIGTFQVDDEDLRKEVWENHVSKKEKRKRKRLKKKIKENY